MTYISHTITQPYYQYIEEVEYNVIPAVVNILFDAPPSNNPADYYFFADGGLFGVPFPYTPSLVDQSLVINGNTASITMPVTYCANCWMFFYYQGVQLFGLRALTDPSHVAPAIWINIPGNLPQPTNS